MAPSTPALGPFACRVRGRVAPPPLPGLVGGGATPCARWGPPQRVPARPLVRSPGVRWVCCAALALAAVRCLLFYCTGAVRRSGAGAVALPAWSGLLPLPARLWPELPQLRGADRRTLLVSFAPRWAHIVFHKGGNLHRPQSQAQGADRDRGGTETRRTAPGVGKKGSRAWRRPPSDAQQTTDRRATDGGTGRGPVGEAPNGRAKRRLPRQARKGGVADPVTTPAHRPTPCPAGRGHRGARGGAAVDSARRAAFFLLFRRAAPGDPDAEDLTKQRRPGGQIRGT